VIWMTLSLPGEGSGMSAMRRSLPARRRIRKESDNDLVSRTRTPSREVINITHSTETATPTAVETPKLER